MPGFLHTLLFRRSAKILRAGVVVFLLRPCFATDRVSLEKLQTTLGWTSRVVRAEWIDIGDGTNRLRIFPGLRRTEINGVAVWLHDYAEPDGQWGVTLNALDVENVLQPVLLQVPPEHRQMRVMLDSGHGGEDGGACSVRHNMLEKDLVLDLALRIGDRLEAAGVTVGYTRRDDSFLNLNDRTTTAAVWRADVFVSLHANFARNRGASGRETFVLPLAGYASTGTDNPVSCRFRTGNSNDVQNTLLGYCIHRHLPGRLHAADRGLRRARFQVLRQASCPAALVEFGFLSNPREARLLASNWYRDRLASAVADGLLDYSRHLTSHPTNSLALARATNSSETAGSELEMVKRVAVADEEPVPVPNPAPVATNDIRQVTLTTNSLATAGVSANAIIASVPTNGVNVLSLPTNAWRHVSLTATTGVARAPRMTHVPLRVAPLTNGAVQADAPTNVLPLTPQPVSHAQEKR